MPQPFRFKQFSIDDTHCAMKVGMDAVLLGAWTNIDNTKRILDIGSGSGIIAIMLAQRCNATIDAVEIDNDAHKQARINIINSGWQDRITPHHFSIQDFCNLTISKYDLIVTNPPYFINSFNAPIIKRNIARHNNLLSQEDLINSALQLLENTGRLCLIMPLNEGILFKTKAENNNLYCNKTTSVKPKENKSANRLLMEFSYIKKELIQNQLIIEEGKRHQYTDAYKELTKDFYLAF